MRVKMKKVMAGPTGNANPGDELKVDTATGRALIKAGAADEIKDQTDLVEEAEKVAGKKTGKKAAGKKAASSNVQAEETAAVAQEETAAGTSPEPKKKD